MITRVRTKAAMLIRLMAPLAQANADRTRPRLPVGSKKMGFGAIAASLKVVTTDSNEIPLQMASNAGRGSCGRSAHSASTASIGGRALIQNTCSHLFTKMEDP